jgi:uncharacterized membrane protein
MHKAFVLAAAVAAALLTTACSNACQAICHDMAAYAEDCGYIVADGELDSCVDAFSSASLPDGQKGVCQEHGGNLKEEWSCQDVGDYFGD